MKKYFKLIGVLLIIFVSYFVFLRFKSISDIPEFEYKSINNEIFSKNKINKSDKISYSYTFHVNAVIVKN